MKTAIVGVLSGLLSIVGYIAADKIEAHFDDAVNTRCVQGVQYLEFQNGVTPAYDRDGKVRPC